MSAKYTEIREAIRQAYVDGHPADELLPTERALAASFDVNRATVRRALAELEAEGALYRIQGAGTFVMGPTIAKSLRLSSFSEEVQSWGMNPSSELLSAEVRDAGVDAARALHLDPSDDVIHVRRLRRADGIPMCVSTVWLPSALVPGLLERDLEGSLYDLLESEYGLRIARAEQSVMATLTSDEDAELLTVPARSPALRIVRTSMDARSHPIEYATTLYRADRYEMRMVIRRDL